MTTSVTRHLTHLHNTHVIIFFLFLCSCKPQARQLNEGQQHDVFRHHDRFADSLSFERNSFWKSGDNVKLQYLELVQYPGVMDAGHKIELLLLLDNLAKGQKYDINDVDFFCKQVHTWERHDYTDAFGTLEVLSVADEKIVLQLDIAIAEASQKRGLLFRGERTFHFTGAIPKIERTQLGLPLY